MLPAKVGLFGTSSQRQWAKAKLGKTRGKSGAHRWVIWYAKIGLGLDREWRLDSLHKKQGKGEEGKVWVYGDLQQHGGWPDDL